MNKISISKINLSLKNDFLLFTNENKEFHEPWVAAPLNAEMFQEYAERYDEAKHVSFWVMRDNEIIGVINLNEIIRGQFQNAFLGYYGHVKYSGMGFMTRGMELVLNEAFGEIGLHRVECAIQPDNESSLRFIRKLGFYFEGYSPKYLCINNIWKDHFKWSLTKEQWNKEETVSSNIEISSYQENWPKIFATIKSIILKTLNSTVAIEHIGSTSVPGLLAIERPNFIVISGCSGRGKSTLISELAALGYSYVAEPGRKIVKEQYAIGGYTLR